MQNNPPLRQIIPTREFQRDLRTLFDKYVGCAIRPGRVFEMVGFRQLLLANPPLHRTILPVSQIEHITSFLTPEFPTILILTSKS